MRQLFPEPADSVEPLDVYRDLPIVEGRPALRLNMIASVDGATAVDGRSGGLGGPPAPRRGPAPPPPAAPPAGGAPAGGGPPPPPRRRPPPPPSRWRAPRPPRPRASPA